MKCKNCGKDLTWGINPDEYLVAMIRDDTDSVKECYYHNFNFSDVCFSPEPDYKFKDYIKRCKRNARSVKSL